MLNKLDTHIKYLLIVFAIPGGLLVAAAQNPNQMGLGLLFLAFGAIGALALQSRRFAEWLGQFF